jgi:hypothetical protein
LSGGKALNFNFLRSPSSLLSVNEWFSSLKPGRQTHFCFQFIEAKSVKRIFVVVLWRIVPAIYCLSSINQSDTTPP